MYLDKNGKELKHGDLVKVFHFKGVNEQLRGRKNYYMYKYIVKVGKYWRGVHQKFIREGGSLNEITETNLCGSYILPNSREASNENPIQLNKYELLN